MNLINKEMNFLELDNEMETLGFYSEGEILSDDDTLQDIIDSGVICYVAKESSGMVMEMVAVEFEVTILADREEEALSATYIKIKEFS